MARSLVWRVHGGKEVQVVRKFKGLQEGGRLVAEALDGAAELPVIVIRQDVRTAARSAAYNLRE
ncbi:hypothetical protein PM082_015268 [Marasmius tenuissimus]|nr:hypothetical protein PM082_015268 [Marasmius tenuissimus]